MALRDLGRGTNDTAASYGSIIHGTPDPVQINHALTNSNPLYPKLTDTSSPTYQKAWKNLYTFTDSQINNRPTGVGSPDIDHIWYMQCLNGLYDKTRDAPYVLADRLNVLGLTEDDILAQEGAATSGTILVTGKSTTTNTGPHTIQGGQYYYLDFPSTDPQKMYTGGCSMMSGVPEKFLCLWTMPYDLKLHRCTPIGLHKALTEYNNQRDSDFGQRINAEGFLNATIESVVVALGLLNKRGVIGDGVLEEALNDMGRPDFIQTFADAWLHPMKDGGRELLGNGIDDLPNFTSSVSEDIFAGGSAFLPTSILAAKAKPKQFGKQYKGPANLLQREDLPSVGKKLVAAQITSAENLCFFANQANSFFTRRIKGKAITSADPSKDFDTTAVGIRGQI